MSGDHNACCMYMRLVCRLLSCVLQARLADDDKMVLSQVATAIREVHKLCMKDGTPPLIVGVEGHTNCKDPARRSNPFNMRLSAARAAACREYVESAGAPSTHSHCRNHLCVCMCVCMYACMHA